MQAKDIILNIAVNLGRLSRWVNEGKISRIDQFLEETEQYIDQLKHAPKNSQILQTLEKFQKSFDNLKKKNFNQDWAEEALTWANILTHRAKLA